jgi:hypothetical protein
MENYRDFEAGPDPFGRKWRVIFKWMQTAISLRMADAVDAKFIITCEDERMEKVISIRHPDLLELSAKTGREITDPWVCRLCALHLAEMIETWEDMDKDLVTIHPAALARHAATLRAASTAAAAR